ncbi:MULTISPECIES: ABC transporter ATP-binding protein [Streptomyces]|uniref:Putative ABC transport system ATP-binding protein n=1 Tax=Streptomyces violarus TaxID=67380 RepID=A0A7W5EZU6_9ACTN|nr:MULTISPECIES: ABC transporter ATP-binding protein [Streptomyces]MBB3074805.1 putative ABC transport system ATP-binding protein [Streptomyces violarus]MCT9140704.1 ABC transporter ATP-binding protein [Streptomyces violarus]WRT97464.1 ABC transporter ATP-binding protein [Streptomyces sp. CGMCC 4.1772]GHD00868.1 ABC transporter ATP-binding protein [Streptomyces violarus]
MLVLDGVARRYRSGEVEVQAVRGVSLTAREGTLTAVMGPSGCGKSTLLTMAGGLQPPDTGTVMVAGVRIDTLAEAELYQHRRRHIGYVFQDYNLVRILSVAENVALPAELDGMSRRKARAQAREALASVGMEAYADRYPDSLSGGQQQRVALARAFSGGRGLILADEPTGALDSDSAAQVLDSLQSLVRSGATCVIVTHDEAVAARADRVVRMRDGVVGEDTGAAA